ncbi:MAG: (2Fe-2S)-binding protein [Phycisphaerae bacterium]|nr:(2Fe-2S)-binding protein [Phycisphaerae bacterium]
MARIVIDGSEIQCRDGINVLQAALDAGIEVPHYCYHPALSIVGSCRLCLMEMRIRNPRTGQLEWSPRLVPSCQTPVADDLEVRFETEPVRANRRHVMEALLLNHPLDCPVCDQAGECWLQDYALRFGHADSRMVEVKNRNPKKDIGPHTLLYQDRCVMCSRCVRFTREVTGTKELCVINRGSRAEIDVFPGEPLANKLQGNVVDLCPVGSLLDKDFLFAQRVWMFRSTPSVCPGCSTGCTTFVDHSENVVHRIRPRHNPKVNGWWICDDGRYVYKVLRDPRRIVRPEVRMPNRAAADDWSRLLDLIRREFAAAAARHGDQAVAAQLSPMMACEEAWLLASWVRRVAPGALLTLGDVPTEGEDLRFPFGASEGDAGFTIRSEKCPNRCGVERVIQAVGGPTTDRESLGEHIAAGQIAAAWIAGGHFKSSRAPNTLLAGAKQVGFLVVQDLFPSALSSAAAVVLPACPWVERDGTFINLDGVVQPFERVVHPPEGLWRDGQYLYALAGYEGLYKAERVRSMMAASMPEFGEVYRPPALPKHQH